MRMVILGKSGIIRDNPEGRLNSNVVPFRRHHAHIVKAGAGVATSKTHLHIPLKEDIDIDSINSLKSYRILIISGFCVD